MRTVESIYISKLGQFQSVLQEKASKCGGAASVFQGILDNVQQRMGAVTTTPTAVAADDSSTLSALTGSYDAGSYSGYAGSTSAATDSEIDAAVENAARSTGLDPALIRAVIQVESSFRSDAVSGCGAQGLMQLMPGTAAELGVTDAFDPDQNVMGGATYLAKQLKRFGDVRLALAAYNTGPHRVSTYGITDADDPEQYAKLSSGVRGYVAKVLSYYEQFKNE